jgi:hypothetical protein
MELRLLLQSIANGYDRTLGRDQPAMRLLAAASEHLTEYVPLTHSVKGSTGVGGLPFVPWVAVFDPDETETAQRGMYVVYLFSADKTRLYLSLNQGTDDLKNTGRAGREASGTVLSTPQLLRTQADAIRSRLAPERLAGLLNQIDLLAPRDKQRPRNYEAANIVAKVYDTSRLPPDSQLQQDLEQFIDLYGHALDVRHQLKLSAPEIISSRQAYAPPQTTQFKPTDGSDYLVKVTEREERRSRKHVPLLDGFVRHLVELGFTASNQGVHPRDLIATKDGQHWLIEVKVVRRSNGQQATREAVAQLLEYRRFCYPLPEQPHVRMLAVFSESVGTAFIEHLESLGIASIWATGRRWGGSRSAEVAGLCNM